MSMKNTTPTRFEPATFRLVQYVNAMSHRVLPEQQAVLHRNCTELQTVLEQKKQSILNTFFNYFIYNLAK
jgi:hypothetical protein